jgi:hypothetical protein
MARLLAGILKLLGNKKEELMPMFIFGGALAALPSWGATLE